MHAMLTTAAFALVAVVPAPSSTRPVAVGHRGIPARLPENTLAGFALAAAHDVPVELDVRVTRDEVLVVIHDPEVPARCTLDDDDLRSRRVRELTFAELQRFDCGAADPAFPEQKPAPGARIPSLEQALATGVPRAFVELKPDDAPPPALFALLVARSLPDDGDVSARVVIESFSEALVADVGRAAPWLHRGILVEDAADAVARAQRVHARVLSPSSLVTGAALVDEAHAAGFLVVPWTVNDDVEWSRLTALHVDAIITDDALRPRPR